MSKKDKTFKGIKTPSRRKFFKAAAATGVVAAAALAMLGIANVAAATAPVAAAALKNLRLEGVLIPFNALSFFDIYFPLTVISLTNF